MAKKDYTNYTTAELIEEISKLDKRKKYGLAWEDKSEDVVVQCQNMLPVLEEVVENGLQIDEERPTNLLIEGDNYHALSVLNYTHQHKIDVIYIDPPYNTGSKDWKYNNNFVDNNDTYRHSKWLSMMHHRLVLAKSLLKKDGVLICAIDENESNRLGLLLEEVFGGNELHCVTIVHNPRGVQGKNFSYTHEYAYFSIPRGEKSIGHRRIKEEEISWRNLRDNGGESLRTDARNCFYPVIVKGGKIVGFGEIVEVGQHPQGQTVKKGDNYYIYPIDPKGIERKWRYARQSVEKIQDLLRVKKQKEGYEIELGKNYGTVRTVWQDSRYDANENGTKLVHALVPGTHFDFPKSVYNTYDCIAPILQSRKSAVVLDFFAGSGTTGHAVSILNNEDGGHRSFILCTNNENGIARDVCYPRTKAVAIGNKQYPEITGIKSNLKYYVTGFVDAKSTDRAKRELVSKSADMLCVKEGCYSLELEAKGKYAVYAGKGKHLAVLFDLLEFDQFKAELLKLSGPISIYVFSLIDDNFSDEFSEIKNANVSPLPSSILKTYRKIFGVKK